MNIERIITIGSLCAAATFAGLWQHQQSQVVPVESGRVGARMLTTAQAEIRLKEAEVERLKTHLETTASVLNRASAALKDARARVDYLEFGGQGGNILAEEAARELAGIHSRTNVIAKVISPSGEVLAEAAVFSSNSGGRLYFKTADGRRGYDAAELHPVVLRGLGFTPESLQQEGVMMAEQKAAARKAVAEALAMAEIEKAQWLKDKSKQEREERERAARVALEQQQLAQQERIMQQQLDEERRRNRVNEQLEAARIQAQQARAAAEILLLQQQSRQSTVTFQPTRPIAPVQPIPPVQPITP